MNISEAVQLFFFFWGLYFIVITKDWFGKKFAFLKDPSYLSSTNVSGFIRTDRKNWNIVEFYLVGVFLLPIRLVMIGLLLFVSKNVCRLAQFLMNISFREIDEGILDKKFARISQFIMQYTIRAILFFMGYYWMETERVDFDEKKYPKLRKVTKTTQWKKPFLILQNHSGLQDIFWDLYLGNRCFVAKK